MNDNAPAIYVAINIDMSMTPCRMTSSSIIELDPPPDPDRDDELELPAVETVAELGQYDEYSDPPPQLFFDGGYELYCMAEDCSSSHDPCCDCGGKELLLLSNIGCCGPMATVVAWDILRLGSDNL